MSVFGTSIYGKALTDRQEKFAENIALYGMSLAEAAANAGYYNSGAGTTKANLTFIGKTLIDNDLVSARIAEIRESMYDIDQVKRTVLSLHWRTVNFRPSDYVHEVEDINAKGQRYHRLIVKPYEEWDEFAKQMCIGFDQRGVPIFKDPEQALKEISRVFGLYKDNAMTKEEDTDMVLRTAGLIPQFQETDEPRRPFRKKVLNGQALDELLIGDKTTADARPRPARVKQKAEKEAQARLAQLEEMEELDAEGIEELGEFDTEETEG